MIKKDVKKYNFTDQEKLDLYIKVKEILENADNNYYNSFGLCLYLQNEIKNQYINLDLEFIKQIVYDEMIKYFPELYAQKPFFAKLFWYIYWWPLTKSGNKKRLRAINRAIKLIQKMKETNESNIS